MGVALKRGRSLFQRKKLWFYNYEIIKLCRYFFAETTIIYSLIYYRTTSYFLCFIVFILIIYAFYLSYAIHSFNFLFSVYLKFINLHIMYNINSVENRFHKSALCSEYIRIIIIYIDIHILFILFYLYFFDLFICLFLLSIIVLRYKRVDVVHYL